MSNNALDKSIVDIFNNHTHIGSLGGPTSPPTMANINHTYDVGMDLSEQDTKTRLEKQLAKSKQDIEDIEYSLKELATMKYKIGDAAFHQKYGNVLVTRVVLSRDKNFGVQAYGLASGTTGYEIQTVGYGRPIVASNDLIDITEMTKVLFNKS